jgi:chromosome partitioning protein
MMFAEQLVLESQTAPRTRILKNGLHEYLTDYDIVIIDCPPNTYYVTQNALSMSDYIIVPMIPDFLSAIGFQELIERLHGLAPILEMRTPLPILGIIVNSYNERLAEARTAVAQIRGLVNKLQNGKKVQNRVKLFEPFISRAIAMSNAARRGLPVHGTKTPGGYKLAMEFKDLASSVLKEMSAKS